MTEFLYIIKIVAYFFLIFSIYFVARKSKNRKIPLWVIIVFAILFGLYAIWCGKYPYVSDRKNYAFRFEDLNGAHDYFVRSESMGLYLLEQFLHLFTYDAKVLFFTVAFLFMLIMLVAYRNSKNSTPFSLLFLMLTPFPIFAFFAIKQAMAMAFMSLGYALYTNGKKTKKSFWGGIVCLVTAILFHEAAWIAIPILLMLRFIKNKHVRRILFIGVTIVTIFFRQLSSLIVNLAIKVVPSLEYQLAIYVDSEGFITASGSGAVTTIKGIPFYYLLAAGIKKRKKIKSSFKEYDSYLFMTLFVSSTIVLSGFMYWMFRFGMLFYMPVCDFSSILYNGGMSSKKEKLVFLVLVIVASLVLSIRQMSQYYFLYGGI